MTIEKLDEEYVKLTNPPKGKVVDLRTGRKYRTVVCKEDAARHFEDA